eukprot:jgi/Mesvir1/3448/Mv11942-RA.2
MGFDPARVVRPNPVPEDLVCFICTGVLQNPFEGACQHPLCRACWDAWFQHRKEKDCPLCRKPLSEGALKRSPLVTRDDVDALEVTCDNVERGCKAVVPLGALPSHLSSCGKALESCHYSGCLALVLREDLPSHLQECTHQAAPCYLCNVCNANVKLRDQEKHLRDDCPAVEVPCQQKGGCGQMVRRDALAAHIDTKCSQSATTGESPGRQQVKRKSKVGGHGGIKGALGLDRSELASSKRLCSGKAAGVEEAKGTHDLSSLGSGTFIGWNSGADSSEPASSKRQRSGQAAGYVERKMLGTRVNEDKGVQAHSGGAMGHRPARVLLCFQDGPTWRQKPMAEPLVEEGKNARYGFTGIVAGDNLPTLALRIESETGERLLGPVLAGEAQKVAGPGQASIHAFSSGWVFEYMLAQLGINYTAAVPLPQDGILPELELPRKAGRHFMHVRVLSRQVGSCSYTDQPLSGRDLLDQGYKFEETIKLTAMVEAGPHAKWSVISIPDLAPPTPEPTLSKGADAVPRNTPQLLLGQPLLQSRLGFVAMDRFENPVAVQEAPSLRVVPQDGGEAGGQQAVVFLVKDLRTRQGFVDGGQGHKGTSIGRLGQPEHPQPSSTVYHLLQAIICKEPLLRVMDTLPGSYLRKVAATDDRGQPSDYFCVCNDSDVYLHQNDPRPAYSSTSSASSSSAGSSPSQRYALEVASSGDSDVSSRVDVDIVRQGVAPKCFIRVHGMPDYHLLSWQRIEGSWGEVRVGPLIRGLSFRIIIPGIRKLCLDVTSPGLKLRAMEVPLHQAQGDPTWGSPCVMVASLGMKENGTYHFPPLLTVQDPEAPALEAGDAAGMAVRPDIEDSGDIHPEVLLEGEDGTTRDATLDDAIALSVTLVLPGIPEGRVVRLEPVDSAFTEKVSFVPERASRLEDAGTYKVVARWQNTRIPDQHSDVTGVCSFEVTQGGVPAKLVAPDWEPGQTFDNVNRTQLVSSALRVYCVDSDNDPTNEYSGAVEVAVLPRDAPTGGSAPLLAYPTLEDGTLTFSMHRGELILPPPALRLRARAGRVNGNYVLQVTPVPNKGVLEPLQLDFAFTNLV